MALKIYTQARHMGFLEADNSKEARRLAGRKKRKKGKKGKGGRKGGRINVEFLSPIKINYFL